MVLINNIDNLLKILKQKKNQLDIKQLKLITTVIFFIHEDLLRHTDFDVLLLIYELKKNKINDKKIKQIYYKILKKTVTNKNTQNKLIAINGIHKNITTIFKKEITSKANHLDKVEINKHVLHSHGINGKCLPI